MTRLYLICAAHSEGEAYQIAVGQTDVRLTPQGVTQSRLLGRRLAAEPLSGIYSSDTLSARATAEILSGEAGCFLQTNSALRELDLGAWEGLNWGNIAADNPRQLKSFQNDIDNWLAADGERPSDACARFCDALRRIADENEGKVVAVVSHPVIIGLCLRAFGTNGYTPLRENTAVTLLEWENATAQICFSDDAAHLREREYLSTYPAPTPPPFDPRVYFSLLRFVEYGEMMADAMETLWEETGDERPYDRSVLLDDASRLMTLMGYVEYSPAAFLQYGAVTGWITLLCVAPFCRNAGVGAQLIGQAVMDTRAKGGEYLYIPLAKKNPHRDFFERQGFFPAEELPDGRDIFVKDIRLTTEP